MQQPNIISITELTDSAFVEGIRCIIERGELRHLPGMLVFAQLHPDVWESADGQELLVGILQLLIEAADANDMIGAFAALDICPPPLAAQAHDLMLMAFFPEGEGDHSDLDDAALLTLAMLVGASGRRDAVGPLLDQVQAGRDPYNFGRGADAIRRHYAPVVPDSEAFEAKLIIWDLDETLWRGTLADGDKPELFAHRAEYVRAFNRHGIVSAICSKNDFATARAMLEDFGLWDAFVFPRIAFVPKGAVVKRMIEAMQLRPANVLFIDDNAHNLHEVSAAVPGISVVDATSPDCDAMLARILADNAHVQKSRVEDYRLIETRVAERDEVALSDEDFLIQSDLQACFIERTDNLEFADRIEELINRSNQLNYTHSRVAPGAMTQLIMNFETYRMLSAFAWDKYGYYGLVGVAILHRATARLEHFVFSCRVMHMGIEDAVIREFARLKDTHIDTSLLRKPLPAQPSTAITVRSYSETDVRQKILAAEAPRDWSKISLRIMADCQSGTYRHFSRFRDVIEDDHYPRALSLYMMRTGEYRNQHFPPHLVFATATDYAAFRWETLSDRFDIDLYRDCAERFVQLVLAGNHTCLILLPPERAALDMYWPGGHRDSAEAKAWHPVLNALWRDIVQKQPAHFSLIELGDELAVSDMSSAHHYYPSALRHISGLIDNWYEAETREDFPVMAA